MVGGGRTLYSDMIGTAVLALENGRSIELRDALLVRELGCNLLSSRKLLGNDLIAQFDPDIMNFRRKSDGHCMIAAEHRNGLFIVSQIDKEADGRAFPLSPNKRSSKSMRSALVATASQEAIDRALALELSVQRDAQQANPLATPVAESWHTVKTGLKIKSSPASSRMRKALVASSNIFDNLSDESSSAEDNEEPAHAEIERDVDKGSFLEGITKRQRNAVYRKVRRIDIQQGKVKPKKSESQFTLKEKRERRELARYVLYHRRFGHANPKVLSLLHTVCDIKRIVIPDKIPLCETCGRQKMRKRQSKTLADHKQQPLALISFDVAGPFPTSYRGYKYFGEIIDNWSRKTWTLLFKSREEVLPKLNRWRKSVERNSGYKVLATMTDNAPEILQTLKEWETNDGVRVGSTEPYTSAQNGPAERSIQYTENNVRAMLDDAELPVEFWCEAAQAQAYMRARMRRGPVVVEDTQEGDKHYKIEYQISPEEAFTGIEPHVHNIIKAWGCKVIAHVARESLPGRQDKFMPTGREAVFMGYVENTTKHHRIYAPDMHKTTVSSNVRFFEDTPGSSIENFQLWIEKSDGQFEQAPGDYSAIPVRNRRGRRRGWRKDGNHAWLEGEPTVDSIREDAAEDTTSHLSADEATIAGGSIEETAATDAYDSPAPTKEPMAPNLPKPGEYRILFQSPAFREKDQRFARTEIEKLRKQLRPTGTSFPAPTSREGENENKRQAHLEEEDLSNKESHLQPRLALKKRKAEDELRSDLPIKESTVPGAGIARQELVATDTNYSYHRREPDPRSWKLPADPDAMAIDAPAFNTRLRKRETDSNDTGDGKRLKAMMAILDWFDDEEELFLEEERAMVAAAVKLDIPIPKSYKEAVTDPTYGSRWKEAVELEIGQLLANHTWEEGVAPKGANLVDTKWVFTIKFNSDGTLDRFKARLVARGFTQQYGIDFTETFAPTVRMATLRAFMAVVACEDLECRQYDIKNAFTESQLKEEIWMKLPKGLRRVKPGHSVRLLRSLYGLKQAARNWNLLMKDELLKMGFIQSKADPCLFVHPPRGIRLLVYVDDLAAAAHDVAELHWFFNNLDNRFNAKDLGEMDKILGVRITRDRKKRTIQLDQEQYLDKVLTKFGIPNARAKEVSTPIDSYDDLRPAEENDTRVDATWYREVIGSLMYAMVYTRPDIAFALGRLSQYMQDPAEHHERALRRLLRYVRSTVGFRIQFGPYGKLVVYSDADWASDRTDRKSITAAVGLIGHGPVFWGSRKQTGVATATTEAEYVAMCFTAKQGQWISQVLRDMGYGNYVAPNHQTVDTRGDNQGAIALAKNPHLTERSKHIDIQYHYVRDLHDKGKVEISYVPTADMAADGFTKPLPKAQFKGFMQQIGMILRGSKVKNKDGKSS
jgi:hypothetical protein